MQAHRALIATSSSTKLSTADPGATAASVVSLATARESHDVAKGTRPRVPAVGQRLSQDGAPSMRAWASCLTLGDLEAALLKAVA